MTQADKGISFDWSRYESQQAAVTPSVVMAKSHDTVNFLDLEYHDPCIRKMGRLVLQFKSFSVLITSQGMLMPTYPSILSWTGIG